MFSSGRSAGAPPAFARPDSQVLPPLSSAPGRERRKASSREPSSPPRIHPRARAAQVLSGPRVDIESGPPPGASGARPLAAPPTSAEGSAPGGERRKARTRPSPRGGRPPPPRASGAIRKGRAYLRSCPSAPARERRKGSASSCCPPMSLRPRARAAQGIRAGSVKARPVPGGGCSRLCRPCRRGPPATRPRQARPGGGIAAPQLGQHRGVHARQTRWRPLGPWRASLSPTRGALPPDDGDLEGKPRPVRAVPGASRPRGTASFLPHWRRRRPSTNAIESTSDQLRRATKNRGHSPSSDEAAVGLPCPPEPQQLRTPPRVRQGPGRTRQQTHRPAQTKATPPPTADQAPARAHTCTT
mgnify:CR=1 FL=1